MRFQCCIFHSGSSLHLICYILSSSTTNFKLSIRGCSFSSVFRRLHHVIRFLIRKWQTEIPSFPCNLVKTTKFSMFPIEKLIKQLANESWSKAHTHLFFFFWCNHTHLFSSLLTVRHVLFYIIHAGPSADFIYKFEKKRKHFHTLGAKKGGITWRWITKLCLIQLGSFRRSTRKFWSTIS